MSAPEGAHPTVPLVEERGGRRVDAEQQKLEAVFASLSDGLLVLDEQLCVESLNVPGEQILQTDAGALIGLGIDEVAGTWRLRDRGPFAVSKMRHHLLRGRAYRNDDAFVVTETGIVHVSLVMTPIERAGRNLGAVICFRDITGLKVNEARIRSNEERFRRIFRLAPAGMVRIAADGSIADTNHAFQAMLGHADDDGFVGGAMAELWDAEGAAEAEKVVAEVLAGDVPSWQGELRLRHTDGRVITTNASLARVAAVADQPVFVIAVVEDTTDRQRLEIQLRHAQKLESVGRLAAGVAHEINTPVQFIGDNVRFLGEAFATLTSVVQERVLGPDATAPTEPLGAAARADLEYLVHEGPQAVDETLDGVDRVATIVRAMKSFGHPGEAAREPVDVNEVVRTTIVVATNQLRYVADVETDYGDLPPVSGWRSDLNQVVLNLLVNAGHAIADQVGSGGERGRIDVATRAVGDDVEIAIADTGGGIPEAIRARIFDPFFTTKEVGRGTGQGLSLVHHLVVERHGGTVAVDTEEGVGTTFTVRLPTVPPIQEPAV